MTPAFGCATFRAMDQNASDHQPDGPVAPSGPDSGNDAAPLAEPAADLAALDVGRAVIERAFRAAA